MVSGLVAAGLQKYEPIQGRMNYSTSADDSGDFQTELASARPSFVDWLKSTLEIPESEKENER